ncbi:MAG: hypothetical protein ABFS86_19580, partial [Planctomycetota bacterium]
MKRWCIAFVTVALLACGGGANDNGGESGGRSPLDPPPGQSPAPGEEEPVPNPHRLDFLRHRDSTMGMGLDSAFDPIGFGKGPFDPPYVPGDNELTLLVDVDGAMRVGPTLPLRGVGVVYLCCLSPDGDTAMAAAFTGSGYELIFVRGLRERNPEVHARIGWPMNPSWKRQPASIGFSADGTWAAVGTSENLSERVGIQLVTGLPEEPALGGYIDLASTPGLQGFPGVYSLDVSLDGRTIFAKKIFHDCTDPWKSRAEVQVVGRPLLATEARVHDPLVLPQESAIPPTPPWEGQPTGVAVGEAALLPDGDTAVVPSFGWSLSQPDARIFIVRGVRSGDPWIARTLGPDDGVDPFPNQVAVHPDGDQVLVANL